MHRSEISLANYPVRLLLFRSKRIESGFGFILIECPCPKNYFYNFSRLFHCSIIKVLAICFRLKSLIFPRKTDCFLCFRFVVSLPRQQILSYQIISCLSTLFLTFLFCFSKSLSRQRVISYQTVRVLSTLFSIFFVFFSKVRFYGIFLRIKQRISRHIFMQQEILLPYLPIFQTSMRKYDNPFPEIQNTHHALLLRPA